LSISTTDLSIKEDLAYFLTAFAKFGLFNAP